MKTQWLFPHRYRLIGWIILVPCVVLGIAAMYGEFYFDFLTIVLRQTGHAKGSLSVFFEVDEINLTDELAAVGIIAGLMMIGFSRETIEDEMVSQLRLECLQWSVYVNYIILTVAILVIHGTRFLDVMIYNMFTVLLVFVIRFRLLMLKNSRVLAL
ncbi:hypothetical protein [Fibrisoma montanum]|nr:hypothetical protein [Fibrisoma montanum]